MNTDIRIKTDIFGNPKIIFLIGKCGDHGFTCLLRLWCFAGTSKTDGDLSNYTSSMVEAAAGWTGDKGVFFDSMCEFGLLDNKNDKLLLHDWKENQKWAANAESRSEAASKKVLVRWCKNSLPKKDHANFLEWFDKHYNYKKDDDTNSILAVYKQYTNCITASNTPSPLPIPIPTPTLRGEAKNVLLSDDEFEKLKDKFTDYEDRIERLSLYIGSTGKKYKSHYLTILSWARKNGDDKKSIDFDCGSCKYKIIEKRDCWKEGKEKCDSYIKVGG